MNLSSSSRTEGRLIRTYWGEEPKERKDIEKWEGQILFMNMEKKAIKWEEIMVKVTQNIENRVYEEKKEGLGFEERIPREY